MTDIDIKDYNMTDEKKNVYQRLQRCRVDLQNKKLKKSGKNSYAGFTYYELKDFLPSVNELFNLYGLSSNFSILDNTAYLNIVNIENIEDSIVFQSPIAEAQLRGCTPIQSLGAIHTYMKRYLYLNALEIVEDDILDTQAGKSPEPKKKDSLLFKLLSKFESYKLTKEQITEFCRTYNINSKVEKTIEDFFMFYNPDELIKDWLRMQKPKEDNVLNTMPIGQEVVNG